MSAASAQVACTGNMLYMPLLYGELYLACREDLNNSSLTVYQKERGIIAYFDQTAQW